MNQLRRLILVRHGESTGNSAERLIGSGDPALSEEGIAQIRATGRGLRGPRPDLVVASSQRRSWQAARLLAPGALVRIDSDLREIDFGRWEGKTLPEVEASDPVRYGQWRDAPEGFEYPGGELRAEFRARVERGFARILAARAQAALVVVHKGVIRTMVELATGTAMDRSEPPLAGVVMLTRSDAGWFLGQRSTDPA